MIARAPGMEAAFCVPRTSEETADAPLIRRLREGGADAIGEAYDLHHAHVRAFARRLVGEAAAAEDLVHEVFVTLPGVVGRFKGESSLRSFLLAIAVNHARHHLRAAARRRAAMAKLSVEPVVATPVDPERCATRSGLARALTVALDALPLDQRVAFVLCEVEERTSREVADIVGAPEGTVRTRLHHAKQKLRAELERMGYGAGEGVR